MRICKDCKYSMQIENEDNETSLECHRHSIRAVGMDEEGYVVCAFPGCEPYMWCAEFEPERAMDAPSNYAQEW